jgi:hypothetical protein
MAWRLLHEPLKWAKVELRDEAAVWADQVLRESGVVRGAE